jgi:hypothetical protein
VRYLIVVICIGWVIDACSQSPQVIENTRTYRLVDRFDILHGSGIFTSIQNYRRKEIFDFSKKQWLNHEISDSERKDAQYLLLDNEEWRITENNLKETLVYKLPAYDRSPFLKNFYQTPASFWQTDQDYFKMRINPVANFNLGFDGEGEVVFQNTRGINLRAYIDEKVYVFTNILENQARFNDYHEARITKYRAIPGNGFYKSYKSGVIDQVEGWDFLNAQAYVGTSISRSVNVEFGHGRHKIGNGIRSLLLSNWAHNYFYLKFNTQVWKFHYQNIFAELAPVSDRFNPSNTLLPKKYMANHYLAFKPTNNFEIGLFETVVFSRENQFELQYLNPVILYRTVEQFLDSPDNVLIGLNGKWNVASRMQVYGQLVIDEFKIGELTSGNGWWANKLGYQLGLKYLNLGNIDRLDVQLEINTIRPYTYSHRDTLSTFPQFANASYSHYNQPLAHPAGANFREVLGHLTYQVNDKLHFQGRAMYSVLGEDNENENWGGNVLVPNTNREMDFGNTIGQGQETKIALLGLDISYMFFHNYFLDLNLLYRKSSSDLNSQNFTTKYIGAGLRINLGNRVLDY